MKAVSMIFGGASGIGFEVATELKNKGHEVFIVDKNINHLETIETMQLDVTDELSVKKVIDGIVKKKGAINNIFFSAGVHLLGAVEENNIEDQKKIFETNFWAAIHILKYSLPHMRENNFGRIVLLGSDQSLIAKKKQAIYGASKAALAHLAKTTCLDYAKYNININCICSGTVDTLFTRIGVQKAAEQSGQSKESILSYLKNAQPAKRLGTSKEIASLACYLLSKEASFINGACLSVDGGYTAQ